MKRLFTWIKNVFQLNQILAKLDQATTEVTILRRVLDEQLDEIDQLTALNEQYLAELNQKKVDEIH